ncbi:MULTISPECIES: hypothetical protein [Bacillus]|uniref:Spore coat protein YtxO n=1 Tax=Bacillus spizizenii (strain DSM 15029 / JCM 12233 / NBRC 101239 / NRRL B-23049 / TU-B-10) TaxID=1052585 RepID=G4NZW7_BACS4|nr:hypothetical protein [Bacillus spizizenii]APH69725.1 hypothetical protein BAX60_20915 [Bacillus subtilis]AEP87946.1 spore coat protein YtxO [Bacillus spizizenii TU-B-10]MEC1586720.1 hypothetical protein [Bacillus spizizenii]OPG93227.1 hypothetical protein B2I22_09840 [Bacillus spizizenii]GEK27245.1 hypothetical protein BSU04nite_36340 [Bacillus spizizenii]
MRSSRQKASISKLDLDQFVFTPPGSMGWQAHDTSSAEKEEEEKHLAVGSIRELPNINAPKEFQEETKEKETDHKVMDDEETKFETIREPEEEHDSKRSEPPIEEEDEEPELVEEARVEIIVLPSESAPAPWFSQTVKRKA